MSATLYERDFFAWTQAQSAALRRAAASASRDEELDLTHVAEELADLGNELVFRMQSPLHRLLQHLVLIAHAPDTRILDHRRSDAIGCQAQAARHYAPSMRARVEAGLDRERRAAVRRAEPKLGRSLDAVPERCPFSLDGLFDEDASLEPLIARLAASARDGRLRTPAAPPAPPKE